MSLLNGKENHYGDLIFFNENSFLSERMAKGIFVGYNMVGTDIFYLKVLETV